MRYLNLWWHTKLTYVPLNHKEFNPSDNFPHPSCFGIPWLKLCIFWLRYCISGKLSNSLAAHCFCQNMCCITIQWTSKMGTNIVKRFVCNFITLPIATYTVNRDSCHTIYYWKSIYLSWCIFCFKTEASSWWWILKELFIFGSANGLVSQDNKHLPEPMMTHPQLWPLQINFSEISIKRQQLSSTKMHLEKSSIKAIFSRGPLS